MGRALPDDDGTANRNETSRPVGLLAELKTCASELESLAATCGASRLRVFCSVSRGEETARSDVDLLVELPSGFMTILERSIR